MPERGPITVGGVEGLRADDGPLFAVIGVFDGLHLGHRYLLRHLVLEADRRHARATVITFDAHPDEVILGAAPQLLLDPADRLRLLGEAGVDVVVVQHFDAALRATEYDAFLARITSRTRLAGLLMTPDAAFGRDRRGTPETVGALAARQGFDLVVVPPFEIDRRSVRSSDIRSAIAAGDLAEAARLLGRPYSVVGASSASSDRPGASVVTFAPPRALPPDGDWPAVLTPWPAIPSTPSGIEIAVTVIDGTVVIDGPPPAATVEVTFAG
ncbi:MAG TPA: FAD synthetase family protein [Candidatus Limnocylindrales bacterium]|nr:FAD synthetase family protein [Candidatus Limnocylindrales bacterium]